MRVKKPNILIFMTDHQRWDMAPPFKRAYTPNLDELFKESVAFTEAYCPSPHCCPSRATFFSGLFPTQHGVWNNVKVANTLSRGLNDGVRLWSEDLKDVGYNLYYTGKWHVSIEEGPESRGWEVTYPDGDYRVLPGHRSAPNPFEWNNYTKDHVCTGEEMRHEAEIIRPGYPLYVQYAENDNPFGDTDKIDSAIKCIMERENSNQPWCHYIGTLGPHDPYIVPKRFLDMYRLEDIQLPDNFYDDMQDKPSLYRRTRERYSQLSELEHRKSILHYLAFCSYEDYLFGRVIDALKRKGEFENTVIVYTSDHGDYMGEHGLWAKGLPCFQTAYRVPMLIRWPGNVANPGSTIDQFVTLADFAPTILEIAGIKAERSFAGNSLVPLLRGEQPNDWRDAVFTQTNGNELYGIQRSVITKEWKYVYNGFDYDELYDLKNDSKEMYNLINDPKYKHIVRDLCSMMWKFAYEHGDVCVNPYIMTAHAPYGPGIIFSER